MPEFTALLIPDLPIGPASTDALTGALVELLAEDGPRTGSALVAPDVALDLCAQYIVNTRRGSDRWDVDDLVAEYLRQMRAENWETVRTVAARPRRGSPLVRRLFLGVVDAAARRRERPPLGQFRAALLVMGVYARGLLRLGPAAVYPLELSITHRDLSRARFHDIDAWFRAQSCAALRRHLEAGGLSHGPNHLHGWRLALVAVALARSGAAALARARGQEEVDRTNVEEAVTGVEAKLLADGRLWALLRRTSLVRDITERFVSRRAAVPSLLD
jgi:hypothetical protein